MADSFLGRWSQRKQDIREGKPLAEPEVKPSTVTTTANATAAVATTAAPNAAAAIASSSNVAVPEEKPEIPLPTMADVHKLTAESDFAPFVARNVSPEVRNSAMKKLFTDPHYNVMDRLDIYIDDYSQPDPIPESMLRQMVSAKFLNLFKAEEEAEEAEAAAKAALETKTLQNSDLGNARIGDDANIVSMQSVAQSDTRNTIQNTTQLSGPNDDHSDLRLQQNHAAEPHKLGRGAE